MSYLLRNCAALALALMFIVPTARAEDQPQAEAKPEKEAPRKRDRAADKLTKEAKEAKEIKEEKPAAEKPAPEPVKEPVKDPAKEPAKPVEAAKKEEPAKPAPPATHQVKKENFKIELNLSGVFEAKNTSEIALRPELWQQWVITKIVDHGSRVKKGDILMQYDAKALDDLIRDNEASRALADLEYQAAQEQLSIMEETVPMDMAAAERSKQYFDEDVKRYYEVEVPLTRRILEENLKGTENVLAYEREELKQLEKMYKADDLVEETEEIILKRQRDTVARLEFSLERTRLMKEQAIEITMARELTQVKQNEKISELRVRNARAQFPRALVQQRLAVQKLTRDREKALDYLKKLKHDRTLMTVKSPIEGIVYYGQASRGNWNTVAVMSQMLSLNNAVKPGTVLLTVVAPKPLVARTTVAEAALSLAKTGIQGQATPVGFSDMKLPAKLESLNLVPLAPGQFDAAVTVTVDGAAGQIIVPGMNCAIKLTAYENKNALVLPANLIHSDGDDDDAKKVVYLLEGDKTRKAQVTVGKTSNNKTEVLTGIKEGDKVLTTKPN